VQSLDEDRIIRRYLGLIRATLRTNHFQRDADGREKPYLSLKFSSRDVPELPQPHPLYEIFVYSPRVEAVHLRGGKVARGGIRWSDRREDFRTEVLGLMKAQMVKNSVIVPVGAKGGFFVKRPPAGGRPRAAGGGGDRLLPPVPLRPARHHRQPDAAGIVPPADVVRHDGDDPYLVVAADKGTATFSDIANEVSVSYGFWLGDAFASGGSAGYDHKVMGITAKGAWESVKRHFRELGLDPAVDAFTAVGVGDMSGDVFGNGLLLSDKYKLLAAFDHRHIFLDPTPTRRPPSPSAAPVRPAALLLGRLRRREDQPRRRGHPAHRQADRPLRGGAQGARRRGAEPHARRAAERDPEGAGRPVLERRHRHLRQGRGRDPRPGAGPANDAIRVDGEDLRCRVVAEGGNLGFTQAGRIAYALKGGRLNTDFVDNSAGSTAPTTR
jgi:glutamate dehydrogenase